MTQKDIKHLTLQELKKQDKKAVTSEKAQVTIGDAEYRFTYDSRFRPTKINDLIDDLIKLFNMGQNRLELFEMASPYTALLILKHFTSIEVPDDIDDALVMLRLFIDLESLDVIINELPESEVVRIFTIIAETTENITANLDEHDAEADALTEQIVNDEIKRLLEERKTKGEALAEDSEEEEDVDGEG